MVVFVWTDWCPAVVLPQSDRCPAMVLPWADQFFSSNMIWSLVGMHVKQWCIFKHDKRFSSPSVWSLTDGGCTLLDSQTPPWLVFGWRSHQCMLWDLASCCFLQWEAWSLTPILPAGHSWQCRAAVACTYSKGRWTHPDIAQRSFLCSLGQATDEVGCVDIDGPCSSSGLGPPHQLSIHHQWTWTLLSPKWHLQNNPQFSECCCHPNDTCKTIHSSVSPAGRDYHQKEERVIQAQYCKGAVSRHLLANLWIMLVLGTPSSFITQKCRHTSRCKHCKQKHANIVVINSIKQNKPCIHLSLDFSNDQKVL